jgi:hypothetical protein
MSRFVHRTGFVSAIDDSTIDDFLTIMSTKKRTPDLNALVEKKLQTLNNVPATRQNLNKYAKGLEESGPYKLEDTYLLNRFIRIWLGGPNISGYKSAGWWDIFDYDGSGNNGPKGSDREIAEDAVQITSKKRARIVSVSGKLNRRKLISEYVKVLIRLLSGAPTDANRKTALAFLREYQLWVRPWFGIHDDNKHDVWLISVSISSDALFWGECIVIIPVHEILSVELEHKLGGIKNILVKSVQDTFMPIMTLFQNYVCEIDFDETLKELESKLDFNRIPGGLRAQKEHHWLTKVGLGFQLHECLPHVRIPNLNTGIIFMTLLWTCLANERAWGELNELERALVRVWAARFGFVFGELNSKKKKEERQKIIERARESLVFAKYLVASPAILKEIISVTRFRHGHRGHGKPSIKTALVIGGPGSGKDSMAKLVRLFSPGYRFGALSTLNMATFRPKEAAVPLLLGLTLYPESTTALKTASTAQPSRVIYSIAGLFRRASENQRHTGTVEPPFSRGQGLSFMFDELNSLDMETQGALLRFLESGELLPLGEFEDPIKDVDALIIGIMNEDPHTITKVRTLDRLLRDKQVFGGMLGESLYEFFRGQRRLRDDLYFRMQRGGEINLPELRERREDIPLLFHFFVKEFESLMHPDDRDKWVIDLSAFEALMEPTMQWEGNVRELQAIGRKAVVEAIRDRETGGSIADDKLTIRLEHVRMAFDTRVRGSNIERDTSIQ